MIFNSVEFALFFPITFLLYWLFFKKNVSTRNLFIIAASYLFYGVWDWRFLFLIAISSLGDYLFGLFIHQSKSSQTRKLLLIGSISLNLGILAFFKYFNFFIDSFLSVFSLFDSNFSYNTLKIILPVGISFYTFQTLSYTIDVYKRKLKPTRDILAFFAFVSFFPQLVAGPIERAKDLLPQFFTTKSPDYEKIKHGIIMIVFGLFTKIVIADRLAIFVNKSYAKVEEASGFPLLLGTIFFAFQLYIDFAAYSNIAIGIAKTLGFDLSINFKRPYLSTSFSNFWSRWHISLSSWFKDYLYIPLGGNQLGRFKTLRNVAIVFLLSGLWHGSSWNFVIWGALNGFFLIVLDPIIKKNKFTFLNTFIVVSCWVLSLVFFRSETLPKSINVFSNLGFSNFSKLYEFGLNQLEFKIIIWALITLIIIEKISEKNVNLITWITSKSIVIRYSFYLFIVSTILLFGSYGLGLSDNEFIYFQF